MVDTSPVSQRAPLDNDNQEDAMETSGNPLITSAPRSGGDVLHTPDPRRWWALALLCGAFFMVLLDGTIVLVALPSIGADLGFSEQGLQWVVSAAVSRSEDYLAANQGANPLVVLTEGFQSAFLALVVLAGIGMALALLLLGRPLKRRRSGSRQSRFPIQSD
jgi:hypothetical protein